MKTFTIPTLLTLLLTSTLTIANPLTPRACGCPEAEADSATTGSVALCNAITACATRGCPYTGSKTCDSAGGGSGGSTSGQTSTDGTKAATFNTGSGSGGQGGSLCDASTDWAGYKQGTPWTTGCCDCKPNGQDPGYSYGCHCEALGSWNGH